MRKSISAVTGLLLSVATHIGGLALGQSTTVTNNVSWVDDSVPAGSITGSTGGDAWNWVSSNPAPFSGSTSHQSSINSGIHSHTFVYATSRLAINAGETLITYVYLDPANMPSEIMISWNDGASWEHRAYWGANLIAYGTDNTAGRRYVGPLPASGRWVRLEVPASQVGLEGLSLTGMSFSQYNGRATWDYSGKASVTLTNAPVVNTNTTTSISNAVSWIDDSLPTGAIPMVSGGDTWNWVTNNPAPISGSVAHKSISSQSFHQHLFMYASGTLNVSSNDLLFTYVYLDPNNPPHELMFQWYDATGSWEHRAYWGNNWIPLGVNGTASCRYMGALPPTGQWVCLQVPATNVDLAGATLSGMAFSLSDGQVTFDYTGKASASGTNITTGTNTVPSVTNTVPGTTNSGSGSVTNVTQTWLEDALPAGAIPMVGGGDTWNWVSNNPTPISGGLAHKSISSQSFHQHLFMYATNTMNVSSNDSLFTYVYLDPNNPPHELMFQWYDTTGSWEHRAYWGNNWISLGVNGTASCRYMGALPPTGQWVCLQVPATNVDLAGATLSGMSFAMSDGQATFDYTGKANIISRTNTVPGSTNSGSGSTTNVTQTSLTWVEDTLPSGAIAGTSGGDSWNWVNNNPTAYAGSAANQSTIAAGQHDHYFYSASTQLPISTGDSIFTWVYLDPANLPAEIMLHWNDGSSWEHRAYWGANNIAYGQDGTAARRYMGPLPAAGQWVQLLVPASAVGLEGANLSGMTFTTYNGRVTYDHVGKISAAIVSTNPPPSDPGTNNTGGTSTNSTPPPSTNPPPVISTNGLPGLSISDYATLALPPVGTNSLKVLAPTVLQLTLINTKSSPTAAASAWDLVDSSGNFLNPGTGAFTVLVNGQTVGVTTVGFKRHPLYAPFEMYDFRMENDLYLQLASPISDGSTVEVRNPSGNLWNSSMKFIATMDPLRFSPSIHVNQEGYMPSYTKKAMVGQYLGNLGEMNIPASAGFKLVDANTGTTVYTGALNLRADQGYTYTPTPYQKVYEADFTSYSTPGEYRLVVPGLGASLPFLIDNGIAMDFCRAYELGLYHQRCGTNLSMPATRFEHGKCHYAPASVPLPASSYNFTWTTIANYGANHNSDNPVQTAPNISATTMLFPYQRTGTLDTTGGHHDAGDYSKYTINCASLVAYLMTAVDSFPGVADLDNLGIPESGDGISDILQEAKWEADYICKIQDTDGGFYFLTYPVNREYEAFVTPDHGDAQVVWPKTTSVTAASVAALAQCASSPAMKRAYPAAAQQYLQKAMLGWQFLTNAITRYGKNGAYQKITHYGDDFADQDELAWAACEIFLATGSQDAHQKLLSWFDPSNSATWQWGWHHMIECYGHAIRSYAFAPKNGKMPASSLNATFLSKCQAEIAKAGDDVMNWSQMNAYGSSFPDATKRVLAGGWYFSLDQAYDVAAAYQFNPKPEYLTALVANMNFEGGCNPVNVAYITGMGWKRQKDIVSQWHSVTPTNLPPSGIPYGNITAAFYYISTYGSMPETVVYPSDTAGTAPYPFYDRWTDGWNVSAELVVLNQARAIGALSFLAAQTGLKNQAWQPVAGQIQVPASASVGTPVILTMSAPGIDLTSARITWEGNQQDPTYGQSFVFTPKTVGSQWVQAEAQLPDGRRIFAKASFTVN